MLGRRGRAVVFLGRKGSVCEICQGTGWECYNMGVKLAGPRDYGSSFNG